MRSENGRLPFFIQIAGDTQIKEARACRDFVISPPRPPSASAVHARLYTKTKETLPVTSQYSRAA